jgi:hypothetical protein
MNKKSEKITLYYDSKNRKYYTKQTVRNSNHEDVSNSNKVIMPLDHWLSSIMSELLLLQKQIKEVKNECEKVKRSE